MHSMGLRAFKNHCYRQNYKLGKIGNNWKTKTILQDMGFDPGKGKSFKKDVFTFVQSMEKVVSLAKNTMLGHDSASRYKKDFDAMVQHYGLRLNGDEERIFDLLPEVLTRSARRTDPGYGIDFDDMIWLPVLLDVKMNRCDVLFVDEAQDLNKSRQQLAMKAAQRIVLVGDDRQAIYGFTGADAQSMKNMEQEMAATDRGVKVMPLTVTRRCPTSHIELAKEIVPDIKAMEDAEKGSIDNIAPGTLADHAQVGDLVVCRMNAPLMRTALRFLQKEIPVKIQGRDFQRSLVSMIKKIAGKKTSVDELQLKIEKYLDRETARLLAQKRSTETQLELLQDQVNCIKYLCLGQRTVQDVFDRIDSLFVDAKVFGGVVLLSSVHRAKGLEAETVFILEPKLMPHPMAKMDWEKQQEMNIKYVAITRSLDRLVFVG